MKDILRIEISKIKTHEEMNDLITVVKAQQRLVRQMEGRGVKSALYVGCGVIIDNGNGPVEKGTVNKINRTRAVVEIVGREGLYNCPFSILSIAS